LDDARTQPDSQRLRLRLTPSERQPIALLEFTDDNFLHEVLDSKSLVVVDFWAERSEICRLMLGVLRRLAAAHACSNVKFGRVDVTRNPEVVKAFDLKAVPYVAVIFHGDVVLEILGNKSFEEVEERLAPFIEVADDRG
jgi:thioredoxin 1